MWKRALWIIVPFALMLLASVGLLLRPYDEVEVINVVETFSRQEKDNPRGPHRKTVYYAVVEVDYRGEPATVTVHDATWNPLQAGDTVRVRRNLFGRVVEYYTVPARRMILLSATLGPLALAMYVFIYRRKHRSKEVKENCPC